jgi:hypothetical protein
MEIFEEVLKLQVNKKVQINNGLRSFYEKGYYFCFLNVCIVERARLSCFSLCFSLFLFVWTLVSVG